MNTFFFIILILTGTTTVLLLVAFLNKLTKKTRNIKKALEKAKYSEYIFLLRHAFKNYNDNVVRREKQKNLNMLLNIIELAVFAATQLILTAKRREGEGRN